MSPQLSTRAWLAMVALLGLASCAAPDPGDDSDGGGAADSGGLPRTDGGGSDNELVPDSGWDAGAPDAGPPLVWCTGKPGSLRGKTQASVTAGGATRTFIYYAPVGLTPNQPVPLIISPHGFAMGPEDMYTITGFKEIADREGLVVVFPQGSFIDPWNVGAGVSGAGALVNNTLVDDQAFIDAILAFATADQCIDQAHVFVSGFSMGGYFSNENGCLRSDLAGIGPHSGGSHDLSQCPGSLKPVILFHGDADGLITYPENGVLARDRWAARNGCGTEVDSQPVDGGTCDYNRGCPVHGQVALCHFDGMGHLWAGGHGTTNSDPTRENAAELAWRFWRRYAW